MDNPVEIVEWPEANAVVVLAKGAVYFVRPDVANEWRYIDMLGIDCIIVSTRDCALIATYTDVVALSIDGAELWRRSVAIDGVEITDVANGLISGNAGIDPPDEWHPFVLDINTGNDAEPSDAPKSPVSRQFES